LVATANNHFLDYGTDGLKSTYTSLKKYNIDWMGSGFNWEEASHTYIKNIGGLSFAFINVAESEWSTTFGKEPGCNPIDLVDIFNKIAIVKNQVDYVIVSVHGGHEHYELPSPRMKKWYRFFIDAGANAVIGHHTHIISGYEVYKDAPIFYGLGNFCFDWENTKDKPWNYGMLVSLNFEKNKSVGFTIEIVEQNNTKQGVYLVPQKDNFIKKINEINEIINNDELLDQLFQKYTQTWKQTINNWIQPYQGEILPRLHKRGLIPDLIGNKKKLLLSNLVRCEAHRDVLLGTITNNK
jgi:poly-gamma-glutamate capsule biosynthesis protein CapA/YwtB (metallophosphatase superfamily)